MTDTKTNNSEKLNTVVTDVAVAKEQLSNQGKTIDRIERANERIELKLDNLDVVRPKEFLDFKLDVETTFDEMKKSIERSYVPRHELDSLMAAWKFATSTAGKLLITALIGLSIFMAAGAVKEFKEPNMSIRRLVETKREVS